MDAEDRYEEEAADLEEVGPEQDGPEVVEDAAARGLFYTLLWPAPLVCHCCWRFDLEARMWSLTSCQP